MRAIYLSDTEYDACVRAANGRPFSRWAADVLMHSLRGAFKQETGCVADETLEDVHAALGVLESFWRLHAISASPNTSALDRVIALTSHAKTQP